MRVFAAMLTVAGTMLGALVPSAHPFFEEGEVQEIRLWFEEPDFWEIMEDNYETETYLSASFQWEDCSFSSVGVRFKGGSSYVTNQTMKKSFKIDFDVFVDDQNISGIYKINLNCNYNDPSFVREAAAYEIAAAAGIPCPRTSFCALYINDTYWGLYTLVEQFDKHFIDERFGSGEDGNLWKGDDHGSLEFLGWDQELYYGDYELKTNESANDWSSLVYLTWILNDTPVELLPDSLSSVMDVNTALALLAVDNLLVNLDSYSGRCVNYYLYCADRDDRFVFGEWDMNESWGVHNSWGYSTSQLAALSPYWTSPDGARPLGEVLWSVDEYREVYEGHFLRLLAGAADPDSMIPRMEEMRDLIRDWVYMEEAPRRLFPPEFFDDAMYSDLPIGPGRIVPALGSFLSDRHSYLTSLLGSWEPVDCLILNELMAGNDTTICDGSGEYDDWLEIVNTGSSSMPLSGFHLTDDMAFPCKYSFPDTVIAPGEYMVIWADGDPEQGALHTDFKLDGDGEEVYLMQGAVIVDWISYPDIDDDVSWGRWPDLEDTWALQEFPTPGAPNGEEQEEGQGGSTPGSLAILCCNPIVAGSVEVTLTGSSGTASFLVYDMGGRVVAEPFQGDLSGSSVVSLDTSDLASGVYVLRLCQGQQVTSSLVTVIR